MEKITSQETKSPEEDYELNALAYESDYRTWLEADEAFQKRFHLHEQTYPTYEQLHQEWLAKDAAVTEKRKEDLENLREFITTYTGDALDLSIHNESLDTLQLPFTGEDFLPKLPTGYAYSGGSARASLERALGVNPDATPRDIDIVCLNPEYENERISHELALTYMPDDYAHGHGITPAHQFGRNYFEDRDFTINEVLREGDNIVFTRQCLLDTLRGIVRITDYEKEESYYSDGPDHYINPKLLAKAIRFISSLEARSQGRTFANEESVRWQGVDYFHMA